MNLEQQMWKFEREKQMQQIALKKIQLARVKEQQDYVDQIEQRKKLEVETIDDILHRQNMDNAAVLQRALKRADVLEKTINQGGYQMEKQGYMVEIAAMQSSPEKQRNKDMIQRELD